MSDPTQLAQITKESLSKDSPKKRGRPPGKVVHDVKANALAGASMQQVAEFLQTIAYLKTTDGPHWLEVPEQVIKHFQPNGLGGAKHFTYENVHVCLEGTLDEALDEMDMTTEKKFHSGAV